MIVLCSVAACGGQSRESQQRSQAAGPASNDVPGAIYQERDWKQAASGRGKAAPIPVEELVLLEKSSAPGARLDAGR